MPPVEVPQPLKNCGANQSSPPKGSLFEPSTWVIRMSSPTITLSPHHQSEPCVFSAQAQRDTMSVNVIQFFICLIYQSIMVIKLVKHSWYPLLCSKGVVVKLKILCFEHTLPEVKVFKSMAQEILHSAQFKTKRVLMLRMMIRIG